MHESVIEQFAATPEGREHLDREEARLNAELAAVSELRAAAVEWWKAEKSLGECFNRERIATAWRAMDRLQATAGRLAELED